MRALGASLQIGLAGGYVIWVILGHRAVTGLAWWLVTLTTSVIVGEWTWRRGNQGDVTSVARVVGVLVVLAALVFFLAAVGIEAMVPSFDF